MAYDLSEKTVVITGGVGNVGGGITRVLYEAGARLALVDLSADKLADFINTGGFDTARCKGFPTDLSDPAEVDKLIDHVVDAYGQIDALVHTVGGFAMGDPVHAGNVAVFDKMMALNARTLYLVAGRFASYMVDTATPGSITLLLAQAGQTGGKNKAAYTASKAAAIRIMESMAAELRENHVRVNGISPSTVDTPINRKEMPDANFDRWVKPDDIGNLAAFLISDEAAAITGSDIAISGRA